MPVKRPRITIIVMNREFELIRNVSVTATSDGGRVPVEYDAERACFVVAEPPAAGRVDLRVSAAGYETQSRIVTLSDDHLLLAFHLGNEGDSYTYVDGHRIPYRSRPDEIGIIGAFDSVEQAAHLRALLADDAGAFEAVDLHRIGRPDERGRIYTSDRIRARYRPAGNASEEDVRESVRHCLRRLRRAGYMASGPVFDERQGGLRVFTNTFSIRLRPDSVDAPERIASLGIPIELRTSDTPTVLTAIVDEGVDEQINTILETIAGLEYVDAVSAHLACTLVAASVTPNDFLWPSLWDRKRVRCEEAWELLEEHLGDQKKFGDPAVIIAIIDDGIKSVNGVPENEDFKGVLSNHAKGLLINVANPFPVDLYVEEPATFSNGDKVAVGTAVEGQRTITDVDAGAGKISVDGILKTYAPGEPVSVGNSTQYLRKRAIPVPAELTVTHEAGTGPFAPGQSVAVGAQGHEDTEDVIILQVQTVSESVKKLITTPILKSHPIDTPVEVGRKTYKLYDFHRTSAADPVRPDNDRAIPSFRTNADSNHGIACAGVAAGRANNQVGGEAFGVVGAAPGVRIIGILQPDSTFGNLASAFEWTAGLDRYSDEHQTLTGPALIQPGADILSFSYSVFGEDRVKARTMLRRVMRRGRGGRGALVFIAAGNDNKPVAGDDWASIQEAFTVGATAMVYDRGVDSSFEARAPYSNYGNPAEGVNKEIAWCTPSGGGGDTEHSPPKSHFIITADFVNKGVLPGKPTTQTELKTSITGSDVRTGTLWTADIRQGDTQIKVNDSTAVKRNEYIRLGGHGDQDIEWLLVDDLPDRNTIELSSTTPVAHDHIWFTESKEIVKSIVDKVDNSSFTIDHPVKDFDEPLTIRVGALVAIRAGGGSEQWRHISRIHSLGTASTQFWIDAPLPAMAVGDQVRFPAVKNSNRTVIGTSTIEVDSVTGFNPNEWILVGNPGGAQNQAVYVKSVNPSTKKLLVSAIVSPIVASSTTFVYKGQADYFDHFSGTSSATPLAAGIAALVLSAKTTLTWLEVADILRSTAVKVDPGIGFMQSKTDRGAVDGRWFDKKNRPVVGIQGPFVDKSASTRIITSRTENQVTYTLHAVVGFTNIMVDSTLNFQVGAAVAIESISSNKRERLIIESVDIYSRTVNFDRPLAFSHNANVTVVTGKAVVDGPHGATATSIKVDSVDSFVVGQEIMVEIEVNDEDVERTAVIKGFPDATHIEIETAFGDPLTGGEDIVGGRIPSFLKLSGTSHVLTYVSGTPAAITIPAADRMLFEEGHAIVVGNGTTRQRALIAAVEEVDSASWRLVLQEPLTTAPNANDEVITGFTEIRNDVMADDSVIQVEDARPFVVGQAIQLESVSQVISVITAVDIVERTLTVNPPIWREVSGGVLQSPDVYGGRLPHTSRVYGAGRLDAKESVALALAYDHSKRDLMIRSFAADIGLYGAPNGRPINYATDVIESPDIWVRHTDPETDNQKLPARYGAAPGVGNGWSDSLYALNADPTKTLVETNHEYSNPLDRDMHIYVRVKNRGAGAGALDGLASTLRVVIVRSRENPPLRIEQSWNDVGEIAVRMGGTGTYFVDEIPLFDAPAQPGLHPLNDDGSGSRGKGGLKPGQHHIVYATLPYAKLPPPLSIYNVRDRTFIVAEITPNDGEIAGTRIGENTNIALREISFARIEFKDPDLPEVPGSGNTLPTLIIPKVKAQPPSEQKFKIEIRDKVGYFRMSDLRIVVTRTKAANGAKNRVEAKWGTSAWTITPAATWLQFTTTTKGGESDPVDPAADQVEIDISGKIKFNKEDASFEFDVIILNQVDAGQTPSVIMRQPFTVNVSTDAKSYNQLKGPGRSIPQLHGFADMARMVASEDAAFGRISDDKFRVTTSFAVSDGEDACVYAAATGFLLVQHIPTQGSSAFDQERVNVIIKPLYPSGINFAPTTYFVYRGLKLADFVDLPQGGGPITQIRARDNASEFIESLFKHQEDRIVYFREKHGHGAQGEPSATPTVDLLGWDLELSGETALDDLFRAWSQDQSGRRQLAFVQRGMCIGALAAGASLGFEVVVDDGTFIPTVDYARAVEHTVAISGQLTDAQMRHLRESVLSFVDPGAYLGMHAQSGVYVRTALEPSVVRRGAELYADVISAFASKNRIWIDIRSENGYSLNYYRNYLQDGGNLKYGSGPELHLISYDGDGWPIVPVDRSPSERRISEDGALFLSLPYEDNPNPVVYFEHGIPATRSFFDRFLAEGLLITEGESWTKRFGVKIDQVPGAGTGEREDVATVVKLHYARAVENSRTWKNDDPVPQYRRYTDNVFGPIDDLDALIPWKTESQIKTKWASLGELKYVDGLGGGFSQGFGSGPSSSSGGTVERGVAYHDGQIVFYNSAVAFMNVGADGAPLPIGKGADGGFSPRSSFAGSSSLFNGLRMESVSFTDSARGSAAVTATRFVSINGNALPEGLMMLGLTQAQFGALHGVADQLSEAHDRNIALIDAAEGPSGTWGSLSFERRKVVLRGLDPVTLKTRDASPASDIVVYTVDGLTFVPDSFTMPALVNDEYEPTAEERAAADNPTVDAIIDVNPVIDAVLSTFDGALQGIAADGVTAKAQLIAATQTAAQALLTNARIFTLTADPADVRQDDRQLYWGRLRAAVRLQNHEFLRKNAAARAELLNELEEVSRGYRGVDFDTSYKKILVVGFDPFDRDNATGLPKTNPSGIVALALHGTELENPDNSADKALVQGVILPVRYAEADAGFIEDFFKAYLYDEPVQMIVTIGQNGRSGDFNIERFAARIRGGSPDNNDEIGLPTVGVGSGWAEFHDTSLPVEAMMTDVDTQDPDQLVFFNQSISALKNDDSMLEIGHPRQSGPNLKEKDPTIPVEEIKEVYEGSAGTFLPNEIFYRVAHLQVTPPSTSQAVSDVLVGHLSIPAAEYTSGPLTMKQILDTTRELLANAIGSLDL